MSPAARAAESEVVPRMATEARMMATPARPTAMTAGTSQPGMPPGAVPSSHAA